MFKTDDLFLHIISTLFKSIVFNSLPQNYLPKPHYKTCIYNVGNTDDSCASKYERIFVFSVTRNAKTISLDAPQLKSANVMHGLGMRMQNIPEQEYKINRWDHKGFYAEFNLLQ